MKIRDYILSFSLLFFFNLGISYSNTFQESKSNSDEESIHQLIESFIDAYRIPGLAIAVVKDNQMELAEAFGVKNLDTKELLTPNSIFHMASVSKPFSATAIMQLVEKGKMELDDPLIKYLPYFKMDDPRYKDITIRQMLMHTSGIPDVLDYEWNKPQYDDGAAERYVRSLVNEKLIAAPGEKWQYSNMAFDILADVIAKVSGKSFEDYIKENILDPLDMYESDFLRERINPELRTSAHVFDLEPVVSEVYPYNRRHAPSSCLNSNVVEMCNWAIANMNKGVYKGKRILQESSYKLLFTVQKEISENRAIGLSWFISRYRDVNLISHSGGDLGFRSNFVMIPEKSIALVIASNYDATPVTEITLGVLDILLGYDPPEVKPPLLITLSKIILEDGVQKSIEKYRELKSMQPDKYNFSEEQLNILGYQLLQSERLNDAIEIFRLNVEMFAESSNPYDSLGEAYMIKGNTELAIKNYKKSVELNPDNTNGIRMLERLQGEPDR